MKIGLLVIATGKYIVFVDQLWESIQKYFMKNSAHEVTMFVFTDKMEVPKGVIRIHQEHRKFPYPTLMRYHIFTKNKDLLSEMDYLYYCDVDMRFVDHIGEDILGESVATIHPYFYNSPRENYTYERRKESTAYVAPEEGKFYFCGGFNGGSSKNFLLMSEIIKSKIDIDLKNGIVAEWHDESHLNRYMIDHPPSVILSPSYCYPEGKNYPFPPKILALEKDHHKLRTSIIEFYLYKIYKIIKKYYNNIRELQ